MKKIVVLLAILSLLALTGCQDIAAALTERQRLEMETARQEAAEAQARALEAQARAEQTKYEWDGRAFFVGVLSTAGMPYYFGSLCFLAGMFVFVAIAFPEVFRRGREHDAK